MERIGSGIWLVMCDGQAALSSFEKRGKASKRSLSFLICCCCFAHIAGSEIPPFFVCFAIRYPVRVRFSWGRLELHHFAALLDNEMNERHDD